MTPASDMERSNAIKDIKTGKAQTPDGIHLDALNKADQNVALASWFLFHMLLPPINPQKNGTRKQWLHCTRQTNQLTIRRATVLFVAMCAIQTTWAPPLDSPWYNYCPLQPGHQVGFFFVVWARFSNHWCPTLNIWAGVEQSFDWLIVQNRQAVQAMGMSMDWILEDDMVDGLLVCSKLTRSRGDHTPFVQAGAGKSHTNAEAVKPDPGCSWKGHSGWGGYRCRRWKCGVSQGCPTTPTSIGGLPRAPHVCCFCQMNDEVLCGKCKWVSRFEKSCIRTR